MPTDRKRIGELRRELLHHEGLYFRAGQPEISDREFDGLMAELVALEEKHPELRTDDSPSQRVGGQPLEGFDQIEHDPVMLSLENTYNTDELIEWVERLRRLDAESDISFVAELKVDGVSISLHYENGLLTRAATRGNGRIGDDVTQNVRTIRSIPLRLDASAPARLLVRGEIYMPVEVFARLNQARAEAGEALYVNPRNTTAGTIRLLDSREVAARRLAAVVYDLHTDEPAALHSTHLERLAEWGFAINPGWQRCADIEEVIAFVDDWREKRHEIGFENYIKKVGEAADKISSPMSWSCADRLGLYRTRSCSREILRKPERAGVSASRAAAPACCRTPSARPWGSKGPSAPHISMRQVARSGCSRTRHRPRNRRDNSSDERKVAR